MSILTSLFWWKQDAHFIPIWIFLFVYGFALNFFLFLSFYSYFFLSMDMGDLKRSFFSTCFCFSMCRMDILRLDLFFLLFLDICKVILRLTLRDGDYLNAFLKHFLPSFARKNLLIFYATRWFPLLDALFLCACVCPPLFSKSPLLVCLHMLRVSV